METLIFLDKQLTLWLNSFYGNFADVFFYLSTNLLVWSPMFLVMLWLIFTRQGGQGLVTVFFIGMVILFADQISASVFKPLFERWRPTHDPVMQYLIHTVNDYRGGNYGFCSSHAANCFGVATFVALVVRNTSLNIAMYLWALINCYSRVYLGVHFVGDLLVGALLGIVISRVAYEMYLRACLHFFVIHHHNKWTLKSGLAEMFGRSEPSVVALSFWICLVVILFVSKLMINYHGVAC
ncbi:MAG: phosphatase PAP2 family protein [Bacteroidales bacterium]|nr:phosphatase PAP2 family protein [Bacteroidales bacterium]